MKLKEVRIYPKNGTWDVEITPLSGDRELPQVQEYSFARGIGYFPLSMPDEDAILKIKRVMIEKHETAIRRLTDSLIALKKIR